MNTAIRTYGLTKNYRRRPALRGIDLEVPQGVVFGCLGPNGAGKTTTIRLFAGLLRPTSGRVEVFGLDAGSRRDEVQRRIGYLPGEFVAYPDLTGEQYLRYLGSLRGGVDWKLTRRLAERFDLDLSVRAGTLSHGNRQKLGIVQAFMHEPELLVLDEPTIGLDPLVQHEFLALIREVRQEGRTVFLSSHILYEVEAVADIVAILRAGRLVVVESVEKLKARSVRRIDLSFAGPPPVAEVEALPGIRDVVADGSDLHLTVEGSTAELLARVALHGVENIVTHEPDLEQIFLAYYGQEG